MSEATSAAQCLPLKADNDVLEIVRALVRAQLVPAQGGASITRCTLLIDDLGLDSLKFVDLTVALEDALSLDEFPMQQWVDAQLEAGRPLTVGELADACAELASRSHP